MSIVSNIIKLIALSKKVFIINGNGHEIDANIPAVLALLTFLLMALLINSFSVEFVMPNTKTKCQMKFRKGINKSHVKPGLIERFSGEIFDNILERLSTYKTPIITNGAKIIKTIIECIGLDYRKQIKIKGNG